MQLSDCMYNNRVFSYGVEGTTPLPESTVETTTLPDDTIDVTSPVYAADARPDDAQASANDEKPAIDDVDTMSTFEQENVGEDASRDDAIDSEGPEHIGNFSC